MVIKKKSDQINLYQVDGLPMILVAYTHTPEAFDLHQHSIQSG